MTPGQDYAPCPHCAANNVTYRHNCWRCGYALPYVIGLDGQPRLNHDAPRNAVSRTEIERLLNQAQTLDVQQERRREGAARASAEAEETARTESGGRLRSWLWLRLRRENPSGT